jgi:hypothetical protein
MKKRSSLSTTATPQAVGEFWDAHDVGDVWEKTRPVRMKVAITSEKVYCAIDRSLAENAEVIARQRGISTDTLINLWIQEKVMTRPA